jgi:hypothetical protein
VANQQILGKASAVLGEEALDVVMVQKRPKVAILALIILMAPMVLELGLFLIVMAFGVAGVVYSVVTEYRVIASTPTRLVLMKLDKISIRGRPNAVECDIDPSEIRLADTPGLNRVVFVRGQKYVMSRIFVSRLETMLARSS